MLAFHDYRVECIDWNSRRKTCSESVSWSRQSRCLSFSITSHWSMFWFDCPIRRRAQFWINSHPKCLLIKVPPRNDKKMNSLSCVIVAVFAIANVSGSYEQFDETAWMDSTGRDKYFEYSEMTPPASFGFPKHSNNIDVIQFVEPKTRVRMKSNHAVQRDNFLICSSSERQSIDWRKSSTRMSLMYFWIQSESLWRRMTSVDRKTSQQRVSTLRSMSRLTTLRPPLATSKIWSSSW